MTADLSPAKVSQRLARLRALHVPETSEQARARFAAERPFAPPSVEAVTRRLGELRALCELTAYLHTRQR